MPVILRPDDANRWLDLSIDDQETIAALAEPYTANDNEPEIRFHPVDRGYMSPGRDDADCMAPLAA